MTKRENRRENLPPQLDCANHLCFAGALSARLIVSIHRPVVLTLHVLIRYVDMKKGKQTFNWIQKEPKLYNTPAL